MDKPALLIIDDDPGVRKTLSDILGTRGYETLTARTQATDDSGAKVTGNMP